MKLLIETLEKNPSNDGITSIEVSNNVHTYSNFSQPGTSLDVNNDATEIRHVCKANTFLQPIDVNDDDYDTTDDSDNDNDINDNGKNFLEYNFLIIVET